MPWLRHFLALIKARGLFQRMCRVVHGACYAARCGKPNAGQVPITLCLFPLDHEIVGRVDDDQGKPIAGALVGSFFMPKPVITNSDGEFSIMASSSYPVARYWVFYGVAVWAHLGR